MDVIQEYRKNIFLKNTIRKNDGINILEKKRKYPYFKKHRKYKPFFKNRGKYGGKTDKRKTSHNIGESKSDTCPTKKKDCRCWYCNEDGHYANECPKKKSSPGKKLLRLIEE